MMSTKFKTTSSRLLALLMCASSAQGIADSNTLRVATTGDAVPNGNGRFSGFVAPAISNSNQLVFKTGLYETSEGEADNSAIYSLAVPSGIGPSVITIEQVAREGTDFVASGVDYQLGDLFKSFGIGTATNSAFHLMNAPTANLSVGDFHRLALRLPVISGNPTGDTIIAVEHDQSMHLVVEEGADVPSGNANGTYNELGVSSISGISFNSEVVFFSALNDTPNGSDDNTGIFRYSPSGQVTEVIRKGEMGLDHLATINVNDYGDAVFLGRNDSTLDSDLFRLSSSGSGASELVGIGDSAPTQAAEPRFFSGISDIRINNHQVVGFHGELRDQNGFAVPDSTGLYTVDGTTISEIIVEGQATPDGSASFSEFERTSFNDLGQFAFKATIQLNGGGQPLEGIYLASANGIVEIVREGDAYGGGVLGPFNSSIVPALNNKGMVVFTANIIVGVASGGEGGNIIEDVMILSDGESHVTVAREGQVFDGDELFSVEYAVAADGGANALNDAGVVAYQASYVGGGGGIHVYRSQAGWNSSDDTGQWDDDSNWSFGNLPGSFSDVSLDLDTSLDLQGPTLDTLVNSLSIGGSQGMVRLILGTGSVSTEAGLTIGVNGAVSGVGRLGGSVNNQGQIEVTDNGELEVDGDLINNGGIALGAGARLILSGLVSGSGVINGGDGLTVFNGMLSPGASPGEISIEGDSTLGQSSQTTLELAGSAPGSEFDTLEVGGTLTLAGTMNLVLLDDFSPQAGDEFTLMKAGEIQGEFATVNYPELEGLVFQLDKTTTQLVLKVQAESSGESSGGALSWLWLCGTLCMLIILRTYKSKTN